MQHEPNWEVISGDVKGQTLMERASLLTKSCCTVQLRSFGELYTTSVLFFAAIDVLYTFVKKYF